MILKRTAWLELERKIPIQISDIKSVAYNFYRLISTDVNEVNNSIPNTIEARKNLENARAILRTMIQPEENKLYLREHMDAFDIMNENLGRYDKRLDEIEVKTKEAGKGTRDSVTFSEASLHLRTFRRELQLGMEHLVFNPLKNAWKKYVETKKTTDGKTIVKDENLFLYFVFLYLYHASLSLGVWSREDRSKVNTEIIKETTAKLTDMPKGLKTQETPKESMLQQEVDLSQILVTGEPDDI